MSPKKTPLGPSFKVVLLCVLVLTILSFTAMIVLAASFKNPTEEMTRTIETVSTTFKMGFGAVVGLIGGKLAI